MKTPFSRRQFLSTAGLGALAFAAPGLKTGGRPPNILLILSDDYGYGSANCYGADPKLVRTPGIDRLAAEGRRFTDANTPSSVCSPTRYAVLTGRYCWRTSLDHEVLGTFSPLHIEPGRLNLASLTKGHGYRTAAIGKWHLGYGDGRTNLNFKTDYAAELKPGPLEIGFDYHFGVPSNHGDLTGVYVENHFVYGLRGKTLPDGSRIPGPDADDSDFQPTYTTNDMESARSKPLDLDAPRRKNERVMATLTDRAVKWMAAQPKDKPFFLYFTPVAVHNPVTPDKDLSGTSAAGLYGDWIRELDRSVERLLAALDEQGRAADTLVIFSSDNGGVFTPQKETIPQTLAWKAGLKINGPWRGGKHNVWEGGFTVPFVVRWPGHVPAGSVCDEPINLVDLVASTAALLGDTLPPAAQAAEDSHNVLPAILGESHPKPLRPDMVLHSTDGVFAVRRGPWKWIEGVPVDEIQPGVRKLRADEFRQQLYRLADDPGETNDVLAANPAVATELAALLHRYRDGGYSREMPPVPLPKAAPAPLGPLEGDAILHEAFAKLPEKPWSVTAGDWKMKEGALTGASPRSAQQAAGLSVPLTLANGALQYEMRFGSAGRHSLRLGLGDTSVRIVTSPGQLEITKNPGPGEAPDKAIHLARERIKIPRGEWTAMRVRVQGEKITVHVAGISAAASHPALARPKDKLDFLVFEGDAAFRQLVVVRE